MYMYMYMYISIHACMHACIHTYIHTCIFIYIYVCAFSGQTIYDIMNDDKSNDRLGSWVSASLELIGVLMGASKSASHNQLAQKSPATP